MKRRRLAIAPDPSGLGCVVVRFNDLSVSEYVPEKESTVLRCYPI